MKKAGMTLMISLIVLGVAVIAHAADSVESSMPGNGQTYRADDKGTGTSLWRSIKVGVGFNEQIYAIPALPVPLKTPGGTTLNTTAPADISVVVLIGRFGREFDIGANQYAVKGAGDINTFDVGLKTFYQVISRPQVKFDAGIAIMYSDVDGEGIGTLTGTGVDAIAGPEFFIPRLPELGFNIEFGFGYHSYSYNGNHFAGDDLGLRSADFLRAGMHYYF